jgi:hypothetical protein
VMSADLLAMVGDRVDILPRGLFSVRGRTHGVEVFELVGLQDDCANVEQRVMPAGLAFA